MRVYARVGSNPPYIFFTKKGILPTNPGETAMNRMTGIIEKGRLEPVLSRHRKPSWEYGEVPKTPVAKLRYQLKMTQQVFAKAAGINEGQISLYESGKVNPGIKTMIKMIELAGAHGLAITLDQFYRGEW